MTGRVALYYDPLFLGHDTLDHPESVARVASCLDLIETSGLGASLERPACRDATVEELTRMHSAAHVENMRRAGAQGPVMVLPDTIANAGGVTVSYFEWIQNKNSEIWRLDHVLSELEYHIKSNFRIIASLAQKRKFDLRTAAYVLALERIAAVYQQRGIFP